MPSTSPSTNQEPSPDPRTGPGHDRLEISSQQMGSSVRSPSEQSVAAVQVAILQAELEQLRAQRDALRDRVRHLERSRGNGCGAARTTDAEQPREDRPDCQALIQRYERIIAEKDALLDQESETPAGSTAQPSWFKTVLTSAREALTPFRQQ